MYIDPQEQVGLNEMQFPMKFWRDGDQAAKNKVDPYYLYCSCKKK